MSTFGDLLSEVKTAVRETGTEKDIYLLQAAGRLYRNYLRSDNWPQSRSSVTVSLVGGQAAYDLPADFDRFAGDRIFYNGVTTAQYGMPVLYQGTLDGDRALLYWRGLNDSLLTSIYPRVVTIQTGGANTYQAVLYPTPTASTDSVTYDYYAIPQAIITSTTISVQQLYETMVNALMAEYYRYLNDQNNVALSAQMARDSHRLARMTLSSL